jgi:hypothetical protein
MPTTPYPPDVNEIDPRSLLGDFKSDLWFPKYTAGTIGPWALRIIAMAAARGYWGDVYRIAGTAVLTGPGVAGKASWMSIMPSEIESQELGLQFAQGHTVVLGLGMGWLAANAALRPEVDHVTVVERDSDIIELVAAANVFEQLPAEAREKLEIVHADALTWKPSFSVDTLQADIWEKFVEDRKLDDVRRMQDNIGANAVYFWGQEMEIWRFACRRCGPEPALDWPLIRAILAEDIRLPLPMPDWPDFPEKIAAAAGWWTPRQPDWWQKP